MSRGDKYVLIREDEDVYLLDDEYVYHEGLLWVHLPGEEPVSYMVIDDAIFNVYNNRLEGRVVKSCILWN